MLGEQRSSVALTQGVSCDVRLQHVSVNVHFRSKLNLGTQMHMYAFQY